MPMVVVLQQATRDASWPGTVKFLVVTTFATVILLASYQLLVRHTWLGVLLNGPRRLDQSRDSRAAIRSAS
jgi:hypothetical protein